MQIQRSVAKKDAFPLKRASHFDHRLTTAANTAIKIIASEEKSATCASSVGRSFAHDASFRPAGGINNPQKLVRDHPLMTSRPKRIGGYADKEREVS